MASSPSSRSTRYSREDYRGCMGGIIHLFDFNQALAGRKYLTDKIHGEGLEGATINPDVGNGIPETQRLNTRNNKESLFGHESSKGKKPSGTPIKSLVAKELSEEPEPSDRTPNVVARLMGLDALPADSKILKKSQSVRTVEKRLLKTPSDRKCHEKKPLHNVKTSAQKAIASPVHHLPDLATSKRSHNYRAHRENDITSCQNNIQEKQPQDFKNEFEAWQNQKSGNHCSRSSMYDDLDLQWVTTHRLACGKLHEAKLGFSQENLTCTKHSSPQERLHESKEFLDAMDFLQCNKEFFMRFLEAPKPLFPKHLQDSQDDHVPTQPTLAAKRSQLYQSPDAYGSRSEACKLQSWRKESLESKRSCKSEQQFQGSQKEDALVERNLMSNSLDSSLVRDVSVVQDAEEMDISLPMHNRPRTSTADSHVPTRIVVLKPSPGRTRNLNSPPLNYHRSSKDPVDEEIIRGDRGTVLQEMKEKLRKESRENHKLDKRTAWLSLDEHGREILKDQREIAQKIARQVKEYATGDSRAVPGHVKSDNSTENGTLAKTNQSCRFAFGGNMPTSSDGETTKRSYSDQYSRNRHMSPCQNKQLDMQAEHENKEGKRRSLGQCRTLNAEQLVEPPMQVQNGFLRKIGVIEGSPQCLPGPRSSHTSRALGRHSVDGASESISQIPFPVITDKNTEITDSVGHEKSIPITLLRSRSVPLSSSSVNESWEEVDLTKAVPPIIESNISHVEKAVNTLTVDSNRSAEGSTRSIFSRKVAGLKGSFSLRRKQMVSKEHGEQISFPFKEQIVQGPTPSEESTAKKIIEGICAASQKGKYQIEDIGPVDENKSSVSSADHFLSLEPAMSSEYLKHVEGHTSQLFSRASPTTDSNIGQQLEHEKQENNAEYEREIVHFKSLPANSTGISASINTELPKEQSEQPSPVSVLDVLFLEDSANPMDFNEISSELQELQMHHRLRKFDEPWTELDTSQGEDSLVTDKNLCTDSELHLQTADLESMFDSVPFSSQPEYIDFAMDKMDCPRGKEPEMLYVKDLLVTSGFTGDSTAILTLWYAPSQPLDPFLFQKVESNYSCKESIEVHAPLNPGMRLLLFDQVNEVLLELLWPYLNHRPWMKDGEVKVSSMPTGKDLVKHVWAKVSQFSCSQSECQETLESLMTKDLVKAGRWMDCRVGIETVGLEVERAIFHDLIEETLLVL